MRRNVRLYIGDQLADINEGSLIAFNYTADDLSNPTIVQNSYSRQVELPATPQNNAIFEGFTRLDRITTPDGYNPLKRAEFALYDDTGVVLEKGYCKLDKVSRQGEDIYSYSVSLYGGLGALFYALMNDEEGNALTLASLDYLSGGADELTFVISRAAVRNAWLELNGDISSETLFDCINFAPCLNGIPTQNFDAGKAIFVPSNCGLMDSNGDYTLKSGHALVDLGDKFTEWEVKDLRSYLQRPVIRMRSVLLAIKRFAADRGYTINYDEEFFNDENPVCNDTWLTLPMFNQISGEGGTGTIALNAQGNVSEGRTLNMPLNIPQSATCDIVLDYSFLSCTADENRNLYLGVNPADRNTHYQNALFVQAVAYDAQDNVVGASEVNVHCSYNPLSYTYAEIAQAAGYTPLGGITTYRGQQNGCFSSSQQWSMRMNALTLHMSEVTGAYMVKVHFDVLPFMSSITGASASDADYLFTGDNASGASSMDDITKYYTEYVLGMSGTCTYDAGSTLRSGMQVTKANLLGGTKTPADYLIGYAKMFGLQFVYDKLTRTVDIMTRGKAYRDGRTNPLDIEERIDRGRTFEFKPYLTDKRYLDFSLPVKGQYADYYKSIHGDTYGEQRVNTGYEFNGEHEKVLNVPFIGAAEVLERSKYMVAFEQYDFPYPAPFMNANCKYYLYNEWGDTEEEYIWSQNDDAIVTYFNDLHKGYDATPKVQFHGAENKEEDGADCLLFYTGPANMNVYGQFLLSDDIAAMATLNDGVPCWMLEEDIYRIGDDFAVPSFRRYWMEGDRIRRTLDMGTPAEIDNPDINVTGMAARSAYALNWQRYIADRYDKDAKVLTCYVDFNGMQVGEDLLRRMYWFDNCLWVLNRITDYDITSYDPVLCEFIKVKDRNAYADTTGEDYITSVYPNTLSFGADSSSQDVVVSSTDAWVLSGLPSWLSASAQSGGTAGTQTQTTITLTAQAYSGTEQRNVRLALTGTDSSAIIDIVQSAHTYAYSLQSAQDGYLTAQGGTYTPVIYGVTTIDGVTQPAQLLTSADGVTLAKGSGDTYGQFSVVGYGVRANNLGTSERAEKTVTFTASWHGQTITFDVTQQENTYTDGQVVCTIVVAPWNTSGTSYADSQGDTTTFTYSASARRTWTSGATQDTPWSGGLEFGTTGTRLSLSGTTLTWAENDSEDWRQGQLIAYVNALEVGMAYLYQYSSSYTYELETIANHSFTEYGGSYALDIYGCTYLNGTLVERKHFTYYHREGLTITKGSGDPNNQMYLRDLTIVAADLDENERAACTVTWVVDWMGAVQSFTTSQAANHVTYELETILDHAFPASGGTYYTDTFGLVYRNGTLDRRRRTGSGEDKCTITKGIGDRYSKMSVGNKTITAASLLAQPCDAVSVEFTATWHGTTQTFTCTQALNQQNYIRKLNGAIELFYEDSQGVTPVSVLSTGGTYYIKANYNYDEYGEWSSGTVQYNRHVTTEVDLVEISSVSPTTGISIHHGRPSEYVTIGEQTIGAPARTFTVNGVVLADGYRYTGSVDIRQNAGPSYEYEYEMTSAEWDSVGSGTRTKYIQYNDRSYIYFYVSMTVKEYRVSDGTRTLVDTFTQIAGAPITIDNTSDFWRGISTSDGDGKGWVTAQSNNTSGHSKYCVVTVSAIDNPDSYIELLLVQQSA